jgi:hypothetical protein
MYAFNPDADASPKAVNRCDANGIILSTLVIIIP